MNIATLVYVLDQAIIKHHNLPGFLDQEVIVTIRMKEADHHFGLTTVEFPHPNSNDFPAIDLVVIPVDKDDVPPPPAVRD